MQEILNYLKRDIDSNATIDKWNAKDYLNLGLAGSYDYFLVSVLSEQFLLIKPHEALTVQKIELHLGRIRDKANYDIAVLVEQSTPYRIKKMLESRIPFLEVGKQMYLPFMAVHLRKTLRPKKVIEKRKKFTPSTQLAFLAILYWHESEFEAFDIAKELKLSEISVSRATTELENLGLITSKISGKTGRKKIFTPIDKKKYYEIGKEFLDNPIMKTVYVKKLPKGVMLYKSDLSALSEQTMLGEPKQSVYAIHSKKAYKLDELVVSSDQGIEEALPKIQLVKYDIGLLTSGEVIDPITLILGLEEIDDRIEMAIKELMEDTAWYEE